jgi:hypothetical protein
MQAVRAIEILERQRKVGRSLRGRPLGSPEFTKWKRDTEVAIERLFQPGSRNIEDFKSIHYSLIAFTTGTPDYRFQEAYEDGLARADAILSSMIDEIRDYASDDSASEADKPDELSLIERLCQSLSALAAEMAKLEALMVDPEQEDDMETIVARAKCRRAFRNWMVMRWMRGRARCLRA